MPLFHGPHCDEHLAPYPEHSRELFDGRHPPVGGGEVVDHRHRQHRVEGLVAEGHVQVVARQHLQVLGPGRCRQRGAAVASDRHQVGVDVQVFAIAATCQEILVSWFVGSNT